MKTITKLWVGIGILAFFSPLGLLLPGYLKSGDAWGEWSAVKLKELAGYLPQGLKRFSELWSAPLPEYAFKGGQEKSVFQSSVAYILSAVIGIGAVVLLAMLIVKALVKKEHR